MSEEMDQLGEASDTLDNLLAAMQLPMPAQFHLEQLKQALPAIVKTMREAYVATTGANPWSYEP